MLTPPAHKSEDDAKPENYCDSATQLPALARYFDQDCEKCDLFVLYDDVAYDKHGWRNRNRIKGGRPTWLTVPVLNRGRTGQRLYEVEIDKHQKLANEAPEIADPILPRVKILS